MSYEFVVTRVNTYLTKDGSLSPITSDVCLSLFREDTLEKLFTTIKTWIEEMSALYVETRGSVEFGTDLVFDTKDLTLIASICKTDYEDLSDDEAKTVEKWVSELER